eukprot:Awhi_evm1s11178
MEAAAEVYVKVASHEAHKGDFSKCLLLYSGGLDTSVMLKWIQEQYSCQVVALTVDIGQTADDLDAIKAKAVQLGAVDAIVYDAKKEFADKLLSRAVKANAQYQGGYALGCPMGRVMIAEVAVKIAEQHGCQVIAHGCTGKGNDQVRFEGYITTLNPKLKIIAPVREWGMGREEELDYAAEHNIPVKQKKDTPYSYDENMWANTGEGGEIEDPKLIPPLEKILQWCKTPEQACEKAEVIELMFKEGVPCGLNGVEKPFDELIKECNSIGAEHGVGVFHLIEDRLVGLKVRGIYENPAATIMIEAHQNLEQLVCTREENELKRAMDTKWAYLTYAARYFDPTIAHINAFIDSMNQKVTGTVKVKLYKGSVTIVALESKYSLFDASLATFERSAAFNQNASAGFIEIYNLAQKTAYGVYNYN